MRTAIVKYVPPLVADEVVEKPNSFWKFDPEMFSVKGTIKARKNLRAMGMSESFIDSVVPLPRNYTIDMEHHDARLLTFNEAGTSESKPV